MDTASDLCQALAKAGAHSFAMPPLPGYSNQTNASKKHWFMID
jgi:hypothetical protein